MVIGGDADGLLRFWDAESGAALWTLPWQCWADHGVVPDAARDRYAPGRCTRRLARIGFPRLIATYKEAKDRLDRGQAADADKDKLKETMRVLKDQLDRAKAAAREGTSIAQGCVRAREDVQKCSWRPGIRLTEQTRDNALHLRKDLLDKLADVQKKQTEAKTKREARPSDSSAQSEYERATAEMRDAEKALEQFNNKYGRDIERYASKLVDQYKSEKESHEHRRSRCRGLVIDRRSQAFVSRWRLLRRLKRRPLLTETHVPVGHLHGRDMDRRCIAGIEISLVAGAPRRMSPTSR